MRFLRFQAVGVVASHSVTQTLCIRVLWFVLSLSSLGTRGSGAFSASKGTPFRLSLRRHFGLPRWRPCSLWCAHRSNTPTVRSTRVSMSLSSPCDAVNLASCSQKATRASASALTSVDSRPRFVSALHSQSFRTLHMEPKTYFFIRKLYRDDTKVEVIRIGRLFASA